MLVFYNKITCQQTSGDVCKFLHPKLFHLLGGGLSADNMVHLSAHNKRARDSKYIEQLGTYDPLPNIYNEKLVSFNFDRIKYWIGCGAHPSKPVAKLLGLAGFFPLHPMTITDAERRRAQAELSAAAGAESEEQTEKPAEV
ncbi:hypothetical protein OJAV_G00046500 [Oryzias javanicus]|uniref:Small ribosomal subunit protein bS16m n=1 Tax=Oryzias javanicus TaxID=123683 RepID=A0A437DEQ1_ORYJA|nr:hypothetical protein OJAV_G00046500 [Oryzias javanicus]